MSHLQLTCLGNFSVTLAGAPLTGFQTDKIRALLVYLALEPQTHQRRVLAQVLWPGYGDESARHSLRQSLHQLRLLLRDAEATPPWFLLTRQTVQVNPAAALELDVARFVGLLAATTTHAHAHVTVCPPCLARLRAAVDLYQGDFLAGFTVDDSAPFDEWRRIRQEQLHIQLLDALTQLANAAERAGDEEGALQAAQRQLALEPWWEAAHRQVMRILAQRGQRAAATAQYQRCRQVLAEELGTVPEAETVTLWEQIQRGTFDRATSDTLVSTSSTSVSPLYPGAASSRSAELGGRLGAKPPLDFGELSRAVTPSPLHDWDEMPAVDFFTGRVAEVTQLTAWLAPNVPSRLVSILGIGGIGKTTLAAAAVKTVAPQFAVVIWRSLLNAPPLSELLRNWLQILARQTLTALPESLDEQLRLLIGYLRQDRCLLVLDNVESILTADDAHSRAGVARAGYEGYDQLLQRLASSDHQSCLLLTSREQPYAVARLGRQAEEMTGRVRVLPLAGLDVAAGQILLQSNGLQASPQEAGQLIEHYSGNPLALQIVAATIADFFGGDVTAFQQEEGALFDGMRVVLDQQFARLSPLERDILVWLAIEREAVTVPTLRSNFVQPVTTREFLEALQALQNRSLLETRPTGIALQNVIIEYVTAYLVEQVCQEIAYDKVTGWQGDKVTNGYAVTPSPLHLVTLSFLNRFALLKAQAKEYVRQSQLRLILHPVADRLLAQVGKAQLPITLQRLVDSLRQTASGAPGYAAGNLLNLLLLLEIDLHQYDFSGLCLWQVHLRNANAAGLRLTGAQLRDPTFTDNFTTIQTMAFHPTGELLAAGGSDGAVYLWQSANWQRVGILHGHTNAVRSLAFAPSGTFPNDQSLLVSGGADGQIRFWHLQNGQAQPGHTLQRAGYIRALAFSPDGARLVSGSDDQTACLWQVATGELRQQFTGHQGRIYDVAFCAPLSHGAHQGKPLVISGGEDTRVYLWDADSGEQVAVLTAHQHPIRALACSPATSGAAQRGDAVWLATADEAGVIYLWDLHTLRPYRHWQEDRAIIRALSFNADGTLLASAGDNGLARIWEPAQGRLVQTILAHRAVAAATFSPQTPFLLATSGYDRTISLWNAANGQALHFLHGYRNKVYVAQFQPPAGNLLATGHSDGVVRLWQFDEGKPRLRRQLTGHPSVFTLAFSPDGARLASGSNDTTIRLWESATGAHLRTLYGHTNDLYSVAFSPDGRLLVSTSADQTIRLWDTYSGVEVRRFATQGCTSWSAVFHPNGEWVATGDFDHQVRLWEVATGRLLQTWSGHRWEIEKVAFSPDGSWLASGSHDGTIRLWSVRGDAATGPSCGATQRILHGHTAPLWSVAFSPDGSQLASCGEDLTVRLWDLEGPADQDAPCQIFTGHTEEIFTALFHPNGHLLASASGDGSVCFWETQSGALRQQLCVPGPYAGMKIRGVTGISEAQKAALRALGAVEG